MALSKSTITGRVPLPTDENMQFAELTFALSGLDTEGASVLPGGVSTRIVLIDSDIPPGFELWQNMAGLHGTHYRVLARWTVKDRDGIRDQYADLGVIQIGSDPSYTLADLINNGVPPAIGTFWSAITQAQYDAVIQAAADAQASAVEAALYGGFRQPNIAGAKAVTAGMIPVGANLWIEDIDALWQRAPDATPIVNGYPLQFSGGPKWFVLPKDGSLYGAAAGVISDAVTDDRPAIAAIKQAAFGVLSRSDNLVQFGESSKVTSIPGGVDISGLAQLRAEGIISASLNTDLIEVGYSSVIGHPVDIRVNRVTVGTLRVTGVMNGDVHVGLVPVIELFADSGITGKKSNAYSYYHIGGLANISLNGIDSDGPGGSAPYINSNRFFTKRLGSVEIKSGYPHNMNFFDAMGSDVVSVDIQQGYSNYIEDGRWEVASNFNFSAVAHNNYAVNAYYGFRDAFFRRIAYGLHTVTDAGHSNELFEKLDAHFDQKELLVLHAHSKNYDVSQFDRTDSGLACRANYKTIFDSGIFPLKNPLGLYVDADTDVSGFATPFLYCYDSTGALITTQPAADFLSLLDGGWYTSGDPLGLDYHYRTSAPKKKFAVSVFPNGDTSVKFVRLVLRTGIVDTEILRTMRVVLTEAKKYNTKCGVVTPKFLGAYVSPLGTAAASVPCTAGTYNEGDYIANTSTSEIGAAASKYIITGWDRLTTGSAHVLNTDWRQRRQLTGN